MDRDTKEEARSLRSGGVLFCKRTAIRLFRVRVVYNRDPEASNFPPSEVKCSLM